MESCRKDFPFLTSATPGNETIYFDNAATTQKPRRVIEAVCRVYEGGTSNVHRAVNFLADTLTEQFESARACVARFINAEPNEIVFVGNATQAINMVAAMLHDSKPLRVLTTALEHHSNLLPWSRLGQTDTVDWSSEGAINLTTFEQRLSSGYDLVTIASASNFLGTLQPLQQIITLCKHANVPVLIDASQSIAHQVTDVATLGCDFLVFSGHKVYGPSGIGVLHIQSAMMEKLSPVVLGGSMVKEVHLHGYVPSDPPHCFEAGTPNIEGVIGLAAALNYISDIGLDRIADHEALLVRHAKQGLASLLGVSVLGPAADIPCAPLVSFQVKTLAPEAIARVLSNRSRIVVRSGFLCAQPAHDYLGLGPSVRASFALYNTQREIDTMLSVLSAITRV